MNIIVVMLKLSPFIVLLALLASCSKSEPEQCWQCMTASVTANLIGSTSDTGFYEEVLCGKTEEEIEKHEQAATYPANSGSSSGNVVIGGVSYNITTGVPYGSLYNNYLISSSCTCSELE